VVEVLEEGGGLLAVHLLEFQCSICCAGDCQKERRSKGSSLYHPNTTSQHGCPPSHLLWKVLNVRRAKVAADSGRC
jgi:hypothetical protein